MISLGYVLQGIKRVQVASGPAPQRRRLPITARTLRHSWEAQGASFVRQMLWAACCTCFHGFLRSGEDTVPSQSTYNPDVHLSMSDVSLDSSTNLKAAIVRIKASKTDQFCQGVNVYQGRTDNELCPVAALLAYIAYSRRGAGSSVPLQEQLSAN